MVDTSYASPALERRISRAVTALAWAGIVVAATAAAFLLATSSGARVVTVALVPVEGRHPQLGADAALWIVYDAVRVVVEDPSLGSRLLRLAGYGLYGALVVGGCILAIVLCRRIQKGRPFAVGLTAALSVLGVLCIVVAVAAPGLLLEADYRAIAGLGLRMYEGDGQSYLDAGSPTTLEYLWPDRFDRITVVLTRVNWPLAGVGVILTVLAAAFRHGARLQHDTEGLV